MEVPLNSYLFIWIPENQYILASLNIVRAAANAFSYQFLTTYDVLLNLISVRLRLGISFRFI